MDNKPSKVIGDYHPRWKRVRDFCEGAYIIKNSEEYLPRPAKGMTDDDFARHRQETTFLPAADRTLKGLAGLALMKAPSVHVPASMELIVETITPARESFNAVIEWVTAESLSVGYAGILVDHPGGQAFASFLDAEAANHLPFLAKYPAESIREVEVKYDPLTRRHSYSYIKLAEHGDRVLRVLKMENGVYTQEIWIARLKDGEEPSCATEYDLTDVIQPTRKGRPLDEIPFVIISQDDHHLPSKPPLEDVVNLNADHTIAESRISYIHFWQSMAILAISGVNDGDLFESEATGSPKLKLGAPEPWALSAPDSKVYYVEFTGKGVESLERKVARIEANIARVGAQILASEKSAVEAAETVAMRRQAENSTLATLMRTQSRKLTSALRWVEWWLGTDDTKLESKCALNTEYRIDTLSPQTLAVHQTDNSRGALSDESYFEIRQAGGLVSEALTYEEEMERREADKLRSPVEDEPVSDDETDE